MKTVVVIAVAVGALVFPLSAGAYAEHPAIGEHGAELSLAKYLRKFPGWRYRDNGFIDCRRGRINSYTWSCRVGWWSLPRCRHGRARVTNEYAESGTIHYRVSSVLVPCYR